jgi:RNA polymerase sigma-70 factor, ECF subfamily
MNPSSVNNQRLVELLAHIARKNHGSFKQLYELTSAHLYGVAMRIVRRRELAEEALQDAFINVWGHADSYAARLSTPMTWLITLVRNKALDLLRKDKLKSGATCSIDDDLAHWGDLAADNADPQDILAHAAEHRELHRHLSSLDPRYRQSLALAYFDGMSHAELAAHLQVPLGTAKAWVRRGLEKLSRCFAPAPLAVAPARSSRAKLMFLR